jgi:predicted dehydrogenase
MTMNVGIIGLDGHPGQIWDGIPQLDDVRLAAIAAPRTARNLDQVLRKPGGEHVKLYADWREMLDREQLDVVGVCDVPGERPPVLVELARRDLHIVSEKPLATTFESLAAVRDAMAHSRSRLTMLLTMRFEAAYLAAREAIRGGAIGRVVIADAQKSYKIQTARPDWQKVRARYGGAVPFVGCHALDLIRWTTGQEFTEVSGFSSTTGLEDYGEFEFNAVLALRLSGGGSASVHLDFLRPATAPTHGDDRLRVAGTEGVIEVANADPVRTERKQVVLMTRTRPPEVLPLPQAGQLFVDFMIAVRRGTESRISAEDAFTITDVCLHARHAIDTKSVVMV